MNTGRILVGVLALAAGGFGVGWLTFPRDDARPGPKGDQPAADVGHRFGLTADDVKLDRERPSLAVVGDNVLLAWSSQTGEEEYTLFLARSQDRGATFSAPASFRKFPLVRHKSRMGGREIMRPGAVLPRLSVAGDRITLAWTEPGPLQGTAGERRTRFLVAHSRDGGGTFSEPACIHGEEAGRPNFTALFAGPDGSTVCAWLDNRNRAAQPFMGLIREKGTTPTEALVYPGPEGGRGICPCCDLDVARAASGLNLVAFRNSLDGYRDIYVALGKDGQPFEAPVAVSADHWTFDGCPHDGPSLALSGDRVHVAWMSAGSGKQQVYVADAALDDLKFTQRTLGPPSVGDQGHPRMVAAGKAIHAVWDEALSAAPAGAAKEHQHDIRQTGTGRAIVYAASADGGVTFSEPRQLAARPGAFQTRPGNRGGRHRRGSRRLERVDEGG